MKPFLILMSLVVFAAIALPFFMTVGGKPIMTPKSLVEDSTPDVLRSPTEVYRWQDADGQWHFGEAPPDEGAAGTVEAVAIEERVTTLEKNWHGEPLKPAGGKPEVAIKAPGIAGYVSGGKAVMEDALREVENLNQRTEQLEAMRQSLP